MSLLSFQGLPQPQPGKWHRPSAVTQKKHQQRPKGEAAKQRASEQPIFKNLSLERACMKMWSFLYRDFANKRREYARCGVAFPWPMSQKYFWGNYWHWSLTKGVFHDVSYPSSTPLQRGRSTNFPAQGHGTKTATSNYPGW